MYTANIADTVMFRNLGKHPNPRLQSLKRAVVEAETEIWVPAAVYHELSDTGGAGSPTNPYLDTAIEEGWFRVATPLPGDRSEGVDSSARAVGKSAVRCRCVSQPAEQVSRDEQLAGCFVNRVGSSIVRHKFPNSCDYPHSGRKPGSGVCTYST